MTLPSDWEQIVNMKMPIPDPNKIWTALYFEGMLALYRGSGFIGMIREMKHLDPPGWQMEIGDIVYRGREPKDVIEAWKASDD